MRRLSCPFGGGGLGGLTISEEGGLDEVEESFRAAASCACSWAKATWRAFNCPCTASSCACNRWQFEQEGVASVPMAADSTLHRISYNTPVNRHLARLPDAPADIDELAVPVLDHLRGPEGPPRPAAEEEQLSRP